jgi:hypothetical protein
MPVETWSAAAGITEVVRAAATMRAALTFEPMAAKSEAADVIIFGAAITHAMSVLPPGPTRNQQARQKYRANLSGV